MHAELFLKQFGHLANSDGGVKKLRQLVLQLAVRGKLVATSKQQWTVKPLGKVASFEYGKALPAKIRSDGGLIPVYGSNGITGYHDNPLIAEQAIVIGRKGSAGALNIAIKPFWPTDVTYYSIPPQYLDLKFYNLLLSTLGLDKLGKGIKPGLNRNEAYKLVITYPPLAEQKRIVAKVDELMAVCDALEAAQNTQRTLKQQAVAATLHHLTSPATPADGGAALTILTRQFPEWFDDRTTLKTLRATILQLAVRGNLTSNTATSNLWPVKKLQDVAAAIVDCPHSTPKWTAQGKICVRTSQFRPGNLDLKDTRYVSEETFIERVQRLEPRKDDILYSREGGILGVACRVPPNVSLCLGQRMMLIRAGDKIAPIFLELVLNSPLINEIARNKTTGGAAPRVNVSTVKDYPIPLPPLAEQHRIVAKVDELMTLCDQLEAQLTTTQTLNAALMDALLHHLCEGAENTLNNKEAV